METYPFNLGSYRREIATSAAEAAVWFNRGLLWTYGFHHEEAIACFDRALAADPSCVMAHWGKANALGPNYNFAWHHMDPEGRAATLQSAFQSAQHGLAALTDDTPPLERALVEALRIRYPSETAPQDVAAMDDWNIAYADALVALQRSYPKDLDLRALTVEAMMNLTPWNMWDLTTGEPSNGARTADCEALLSEAFDTQPDAKRHPGLLHMHVHLMEMSPHPEEALNSADALRSVAADLGHLAHMPTHIDVLCGDYSAVVRDNQRGVAADEKVYAQDDGMTFYTAYRQHNYHFVIYGAMFLGQMQPALNAADRLNETTPDALLRLPSPPMADFLEAFLAMKPHVLIRFGRWKEILELDLPEDRALHCTSVATIHYAQGLAHAALGNVAAARAAQALFKDAVAAIPETRLLHNNTVTDLMQIAAAMLEGEIAYREEDYAHAFSELRRSVALDDALPYDEPWGWMMPTRHALGALLLEQGHVAEAEQVYREDLGLAGGLPRSQVHPDNLWALRGLADCLAARDASHTDEGRLIAQRLALAQARADVGVQASCFCAQKAMNTQAH